MGSEFETESELTGFEEGVLETLKRCEQRNETTLVSAMEVAKCLRSWQVQLPSPELGQLLVSRLCSSSSSSSSSSSLWKFIEQALSSRLLYPLQLLSLLTSRYLIDFHIFQIHLPLIKLKIVLGTVSIERKSLLRNHHHHHK